MPYRTDDQMWSVDKSFLGFPGLTLPRPVQYTVVGIAVAMLLLLGIVLRMLLHLEGRIFIWLWLGLTWFLTKWLAEKLQRDTSFKALVTGFFNELRAPREPAPGKPIEFAAVPIARRLHRAAGADQNSSGDYADDLEPARTGQ